MVKTHVTAFGKGIAAEFAPLAQQVVATAYLRLQPIVPQRTPDDVEMTFLAVQIGRRHETEIDVAVIVVDSAATRSASHHIAPIGKQCFDIAFRERVLVLSDNHRATVLPQIHRHHISIPPRQEVILYSNIPVRVGLVADNILEPHIK